jgi:hypothetical protein
MMNERKIMKLRSEKLVKTYKGRTVVNQVFGRSKSRRDCRITRSEWRRKNNLVLHDGRFDKT